VCVQAALIVAGKHLSLGRRSLALTWWQLARFYGHVETLQDGPLIEELQSLGMDLRVAAFQRVADPRKPPSDTALRCANPKDPLTEGRGNMQVLLLRTRDALEEALFLGKLGTSGRL